MLARLIDITGCKDVINTEGDEYIIIYGDGSRRNATPEEVLLVKKSLEVDEINSNTAKVIANDVFSLNSVDLSLVFKELNLIVEYLEMIDIILQDKSILSEEQFYRLSQIKTIWGQIKNLRLASKEQINNL